MNPAVTTGTSHVEFVQGNDRVANVRAAMGAVIEQLPWSTYRNVVVKPNLVVYDAPYAVTHRDTLDAVLAMVRDRYSGKLTIAEGCGYQSTVEGFRYHRYAELAERYACALVDLNSDEVRDVGMFRQNGASLHLRIARTILDSDCRISLTLPKTHDAVQVTLSIKNMIMASLINRRPSAQPARPDLLDRIGKVIYGHGNGWGSDKAAMHQGPLMMNINLARVAPLVWPQLVLIDGFVGMEGAGPIWGDPVEWQIAAASTDALAADATMLNLMGYKLEDVGYLHYCSQAGLGNYRPDQVVVNANVDLASVMRTFRPHPTNTVQRRWEHPDAQLWLTKGLEPVR